jgi:subtilisin family serine protease
MMPRRILRLLAALLLALGFGGGLPGALAQPNQAPAIPARQILVMLKVPPQHFQPGKSYGGSYGDTASLVMRNRTAQSIARNNQFEVVDGWPMPLLGVDCYVMRIGDGESIEAAIERVSRDSRVAWAEPMQLYQARGSGLTDPLYAIEPAAQKWRLSDLHKVATGRGVSVAVIDSKVEVTHPDLQGKFIADKNFLGGSAPRSEEHGTGVAGIIAATAHNGLGIEGIAPDAQLMALRACWQEPGKAGSGPTLCESLGIARALQYAIDHNAKVINLSLSGPPGLLLGRLISIALSRNTSVVAAFDPSLPKGGFPASMPGVIAVTDQSLQNMPRNVYGAPGRDIPTTQPGGKWYLVNGSSYSAAHVSGLIALVRERRSGPALPLIRSTSGAIDACATLLRTSPACDCDCRLGQSKRGELH